MKNRLSIALTFATLLAACAQTSSPQQTLSQKLEGKSAEERQEILRLACLNEAEYATDTKKTQHQRRYGAKRVHMVRDTQETAQLKTLCREMTDNYPQKE